MTLREYTKFLDTLSPEDRDERIPRSRDRKIHWIHRDANGWHIDDHMIEGEGRKRVPRERELDLPVTDISWFDAVAYCEWLSSTTGQKYRLPTSLEWDKAARGADGRPFPMALRFDPSLAKLRESRPEASQPETIGSFIGDKSPYGVRDTMGGVHDWTASVLKHSDVAFDETTQATIRGGSWTTVHLEPLIVRTMYRAVDRAGWVGFRMALTTSEPWSSVAITPMAR